MKNFLLQLPHIAKAKHAENLLFREHLRAFPNAKVDECTHQLYKKIAASIDCTQCGNCCRKLEPEISADEAQRLATLHTTSLEDFLQTHTQSDNSKDLLFLTAKPCLFLNGNICSIYTQRPSACADYPHLHHPNTKYRMKRILAQYAICPIVYEVVEGLKSAFSFPHSAPETKK